MIRYIPLDSKVTSGDLLLKLMRELPLFFLALQYMTAPLRNTVLLLITSCAKYPRIGHLVSCGINHCLS